MIQYARRKRKTRRKKNERPLHLDEGLHDKRLKGARAAKQQQGTACKRRASGNSGYERKIGRT